MKDDDIQRFRDAYSKLSRLERVNFPVKLLDINIPSVGILYGKFFNDLDEVNFGFGWWTIYPIGTKRRIFISDYVLQCAEAISVNFSEAKVSLLEYRDLNERFAKRMRGMVTPGGAQHIEHLDNSTFDEHLEIKLLDIHLANLLRTIGTILDCLAACIVVVLALKDDVLKASFSALDERKIQASLENFQRDAYLKIKGIEAKAGPEGWLPWILSYRNMIVHRGRLATFSFLDFVPVESERGVLTDQRGYPLGSTNAITLAPAKPDLSEMELLASGSGLSKLSENQTLTLEGAYQCLEYFVEETSKLLIGIWDIRKTDRSLANQPKEQWKLGRVSKTDFKGFVGDSFRVASGEMHVGSALAKRMKAAAVLDGDRYKWAQFD